MRYLLQYPYGCLEQTVSAAFPAAVLRRFGRHLSQQKPASQPKPQRYNPNYQRAGGHPQN
ncbi:MAG: hypothetical protein WKG07_27595 [Hymenobacter sp.]